MCLAASPGPGGPTGSQPKVSRVVLGHAYILESEVAASQGGPGRNAEFPETHWDKQFLPSTLQKLQELQARAAVVSSLGTLQDDDSELERTAVQVSSCPCPSHPSPLCAPALGMSGVSLGSSEPRNGTRKVPGHAMIPNHAS